jgi:ABC-2 type transport system ATP-binding protein
LIILDEPCIGLDAFARLKYEEMVKELKEKQKTIILSSHNMCEIDHICTRIILLDDGKITFYGDKRELFRQYAPIDIMTVKCLDKIPNMQDLPVNCYTMDDLKLTISYNTNVISASEIIRVLLQSTSISEVTVKKPSLEDVISAIERK